MQHNMGNSGFPYDFENPESYVPPIEFRRENELLGNNQVVSESISTRRSVLRSVGRGVVAGLVINVSFGVYNRIIDKNDENPVAVDNYYVDNDGDCIEANYDLELTQAELETAIDNDEEQSALSIEERDYLYELLYGEAEDLNDIEDILSKVFSRWGINVYVGKLPDDMDDIYQDLSELKQEDVIESTASLISFLSNTSNKLMEQGSGLNVYFGHNFYNSKGLIGGLRTAVNKYGEPKETLLIDIAAGRETADIFMHEFSHTIHARMCETPENDRQLSSINTLEYTRVYKGNEDVQLYGFKTPYGAVNIPEDFATNAEDILKSGAQYCYDTQREPINDVICAKEKLFLGRLNAIDPEISDYYIARAEAAYRGVKEDNPLFEYKPSPYLEK